MDDIRYEVLNDTGLGRGVRWLELQTGSKKEAQKKAKKVYRNYGERADVVIEKTTTTREEIEILKGKKGIKRPAIIL